MVTLYNRMCHLIINPLRRLWWIALCNKLRIPCPLLCIFTPAIWPMLVKSILFRMTASRSPTWAITFFGTQRVSKLPYGLYFKHTELLQNSETKAVHRTSWHVWYLVQSQWSNKEWPPHNYLTISLFTGSLLNHNVSVLSSTLYLNVSVHFAFYNSFRSRRNWPLFEIDCASPSQIRKPC